MRLLRLSKTASTACICFLGIGPLMSAQSQPGNDSKATQPLAASVAQLLARARAYNESVNGMPDYSRAFQLFQQASQQGSAEAKAWLGSMYLRGHGTSKNIELAYSLVHQASDANDPVGLRFMGMFYQNGLGVAQDYSQAKAYYEKAIALNNAYACGALGRMYLFGLGVQRNKSKAIDLFSQGAALGDPWSQTDLGGLYERGRVALSADDKAANSVPASSEAGPDYAMALKYYNQAAAAGNRVAIFRLGQMYENGRGVKQDYSQAFQYYQRAALRGLPEAQRAFGRLNEEGLGIDVNYIAAYTFYGLAARNGDAAAEQNLQSLSRQMTSDQRQQAEVNIERIHQRRIAEQEAQ